MFDAQDFSFLFASKKTGVIHKPVEDEAAWQRRVFEEAEVVNNLSRLTALYVNDPVRYDPPAHIPVSWVFDEQAKRYVKPEPRFFFSGDGANKTRVVRKRHTHKTFARA
jgi:hypothetical protein